jgi:hypothetical protein
MTYEIIKKNYKSGLWCKQMVQLAVTKKVITQEQFDEITKEEKSDK